MALPNPIAGEQNLTDAVTFVAASAITAKRFVGGDSNPCAAGAKAVGVSLWDAATGETITVYGVGNIALVEAGGPVSIGDLVGSDAYGKAVAVVPLAVAYGAGSTAVEADAATPTTTFSGGVLPVSVNGQALAIAAQDGDVIAVLVM